MSNEGEKGIGPAEQDPYYILAAASLADDRRRVLKHGDTFAVFDNYGDMRPVGLCEQGLYHEGTRFLSCLLLRLGHGRPMFLSSTIKEDNACFVADLTNPDMQDGGSITTERDVLHLCRTRFLWKGAMYECLHLKNFGLSPVEIRLGLHFEADFMDVFEVRGIHRKRRGQMLDAEVNEDTVTLAYQGLDGSIRRTRLAFFPQPEGVKVNAARYRFTLSPNAEESLYVTVACLAEQSPSAMPFDTALAEASASMNSIRDRSCRIRSSEHHFNVWINRAAADLYMLNTETPSGLYPFAGIPWFNAPFGRDGIISALECLWIDPELARGVLGFLAATQAQKTNPQEDAEPGKILHETRRGEMAALGEIPFGRYYGSVDATPLFVLLAGAYYERTADVEFVRRIWPNVQAALNWIDEYGDCDGDGFVEYVRHSAAGLESQGWKDSRDAVFHSNGRLAEGPIALCEVQSYVYGAKCAAAELARVLGHITRAEELERQALALRDRFEAAYWSDDLGTYVLALDGAKRPCAVRTSNAGHCLLTRLASPERAVRLAQTLLAEESFSGWGVRTVAASEARYNPMSYHNGSVWPHDNALIAFGLSRYGLKEQTLQIMRGLFDSSLFFDLHRLPELFCGFPRRSGEGPTLYPVACSPQAWAAATVFCLLQSCLGLHVSATESQVRLMRPILPPSLDRVQVHNLRVGPATIDLQFLRYDNNVGVNVLRREGKIEIVTVK